MRSIDWSKTALGPVEGWPQSLRTTVSTCLNSRFPILVWWGPELVMLYNDAYVPVLGSKHPRSLGTRGREVWPEVWHIIGPMLEGVMGQGEATWSENIMLPLVRRGFAEECYFTFSYSPIRDESGGVGGVFTAVYETTGQVLSERRLRTLQLLPSRVSGARTAEEACALAADALKENHADVPFCRVYLLADDGGEARLAASTGLSPEATRSPERLPLAEDGPVDEWALREALRTGVPVLVEEVARRFGALLPPGVTAPLEKALVLPLVRPGTAEPTGVLVAGLSPHLSLDAGYRSFLELVAGQVTTAIASVRELQEAKKRAEALAELDRAKTAFFSNVSHEFRTPLTLMLGPLEDGLADTRHPLPPEQRERQLLVHRNGLRLMRLVNALLEFSRIEAGRVKALYEPTDLAALTRDLVSAFRSAVEKAGLRLRVDCPPLEAPVWVDQDMWEKVVLNLLSNAFKFTLEGEIRVTQHLRDAHVELSVEDTGVGIPEAELPRVFERFHRVEQSKGRSIEGSGIGLALVQELVKLHGGRVTVRSAAGRGSTFTVCIPTGNAHLPKDRLGTSGAPVARTRGVESFVQDALHWLGEEPAPGLGATDTALVVRGASPEPAVALGRVLLADDNADMRGYVARILSGAGWKVETARDGLEALAATRARVPDVVLSDVMMPGLDGFGLLDALRKEPRTADVPIILLSARAGEEATVEGLKAGANDYLVKPFSARELLARVEGAVRTARAQREQRRAEADRERFFQLAPDLFCIAGMDAYFRRVNPAFPQTLGWSEEELYAQTFLSLVHPDDVAATLAEMKKLAQGQVTVRLENRYRCKNGEYKWLAWAAAPVVEQGFMYAAARDITEARRAQVERERLLAAESEARREAEAANRLKDEFLSTVSHELRTPLTAMLGWVQLLRTGNLPLERQARALETVERNARAQGQLIEDLLDVSRILSGKMRLEVEPVDVSTVVEQALDSVRPAADAKGIRVQSVMDSAGTIMGDSHRLQQVVWNLLSNAVKFTPRGGRVQVFVERRDSSVEITVADTGRGIEPAFLPHVFERFRQADSGTRRQYGGLGLGLSIVRHLVEMHGGTVSAASRGEGSGATFIVKLPVSVALRPEPPSPSGPQPDLPRRDFHCPPRLAGLRVLLVDDEEDTREYLRSLLEGCEMRVVAVGSAAEGLEALRRGPPDLLVSDIGMPEEDGYGFIEKVRALPASEGGRTPAAALTAYARVEDRTRVLLAGFQCHVPKPVEPGELLAVLAALAGQVVKDG
ncbi:response regulator [Pyxidicoccus fallax]|uniref:histidine kinase n=2 Tax=Pyxidicoccus fallax TaxID=394095 RepID=A0A848LE73_9BACT|nr:response regulator [Pyxidicoccus fallax]NPC79442.1 response regulator [Pyxidicoccus fallax]